MTCRNVRSKSKKTQRRELNYSAAAQDSSKEQRPKVVEMMSFCGCSFGRSLWKIHMQITHLLSLSKTLSLCHCVYQIRQLYLNVVSMNRSSNLTFPNIRCIHHKYVTSPKYRDSRATVQVYHCTGRKRSFRHSH
jgi:hypothetical protein